MRFTESKEGKEREGEDKRHLSGDSTPVVTRQASRLVMTDRQRQTLEKARNLSS